jgi:rsbT antagonist protein RsbS
MVQGMHLTPIGDGNVLLEPSDGLDPGEPDTYLVPLTGALQQMRAQRLLYDLKNVPVVDKLYYTWLVSVAAMCRISGIDMVVVNMRPATAYALALTMKNSPSFDCALDVDRARNMPSVTNRK